MKIKDKRLFELLKEYLTIYLPLQKNVSSNTSKSYRQVLNIFIDFLCQSQSKSLKEIGFDDFSGDNVNLFLQWLEDTRNCGFSTINHHLSAWILGTRNDNYTSEIKKNLDFIGLLSVFA